MRRFRHQRNEIPERIVSGAAGGYFIMRLGFYRVNEVRELDRVLNEEHRHVVADQIEVAFIGVKLHRKSAHVTHGIARATRPLDGGKAREHRGLFPWVLEETGLGQGSMVFIGLEVSVRRRAPRMNDALGNALMVKVGDFFTHDEIFKQGRTAITDLERVLVIGNFYALIGA